jgi:hypothetical protein
MLTTMLTPIWAGTNQVNFFPFDTSPTKNPHLGIASRHFPVPTAFHNQNPPNSFPPPAPLLIIHGAIVLPCGHTADLGSAVQMYMNARPNEFAGFNSVNSDFLVTPHHG